MRPLAHIQTFFKTYERYFLYLGISLVVVGMPLSNFLMSLSQFVLLGIWLLTGDHKAKLLTLLRHKNAMLLVDLFLVYVFGLFYSSNYAEAWHEIRIKIPLLIFPLIMVWYRLSLKEISLALGLFIIAVLASTTYSFLVYLRWTDFKYQDIREISRFISHIRLSLEVVLALFLLWLFPWPKFRMMRSTQALLSAWFLFYLWISQSLTGLVILSICLLVYLISMLFSPRQTWVKWSVGLLVMAFLTYGIMLFVQEASYYTHLAQKNPVEYPSKTAHGNEYFQDMQSTQVENGHYIWRFVCWKELEQNWESTVKTAFLGKDSLGNPQYATLIRYMTSKGLKKDQEGFQQLNSQDLQNIQRGYTNVRFTKGLSLSRRIYELFWELDAYYKGIPPMKGSVSQRLEFWKVALQTVGSDLWTGKGTGNVQNMMIPAYEKSMLKTHPEYWLKPHQQFLTLAIQFGWVQMAFVLGTLLLLLYRHIKTPVYLYFFLIYLLSFFTEDTLDTQAGITWYIFFQGVFVVWMASIKEPSND